MKIGQAGIDLIKQFEGCVLHVYKDAVGLPTIGIGHLIKPGEKFTTITMQEAEDLLRSDIKIFEDALNKSIKVPVTQNQFDAMLSLAFNIGYGAFNKSTLLKKVNLKDFVGASNEFRKWNKAGGKVLTGLVRRRTAEQQLFTKVN